MGKYDKGILGAISGKVGTVVGSKWKGIRYLRSLSGPRKVALSEAQIHQQARFGMGVKFLQPMHPVIKIGYRTQVKQQSPHNAALSDLLTSAIEGDYPDFRINYNRFRMAKGSMEPPRNANARFEDNEVIFTWEDNTGSGDASEDDGAMLMVCSEGLWPVYDVHNYTRADGIGRVIVDTANSGQTLYCFMAFAGQGYNRSVSNSTLVATITVP